ncbi:MAG: polysaccharide deacetylase family protein [Anaerolineales bacterium]|nr:polysaccharide deacetylase family protein [Anaerolineales bacterium]MCX7754568.1 polysaccharide deacetylase family protein [Anaerolineales bacterium]MDW8277193.1 polysaccharide deacetylase family protein [Anaerolineales bacterium]
MTLPGDPNLARRIPAIEYHDTEYKGGQTVQMTTPWFLAQMEWLNDNGYYTLNNEEMLRFVQGEYQPPKRSCFLRFDVGMPIYRNLQEVIVPTLVRYGFRATFFVLTSAIKESSNTNDVCWSHLREWEQTGLIEIGSHGVYHPDYRTASTATRVWDARESKRIIESQLGHPIRFFAFPFDSVPNNPGALLKLFGYQLGFAGNSRIKDRSILFKDPNPYSLPCYYPYSYRKIYPQITGTARLTFGQMIEAAIR